MRIHFNHFVLVAIVASLLVAFTSCGRFSRNSSGNEKIVVLMEAVRKRAREGDLREFSIIYFPKENLTRGRLTSDMLEQVYRFKITERDLGDGRLLGSFCKAVEDSAIKDSDLQPDLRWGGKIVANDGSVVCSFYCDGKGSFGLINGQPIAIRGALSSWLLKISSCLE